MTQTWPSTEGAGITVAVLGTGVDPRHPDLAGSVTTGPDFTGSGRTEGGPFWGVNGTEVAGAIAGHGHGTGRADGLLGIAPAAKILSIRVGLEYNDPLNSDRAIAGRLPSAIASGIIYAVDHGARVIDLPLDPGTAGLTGQGSPAAAGGSPAEKAAVAYALRKNVVLVAPAGDDGQGPGLKNYPAAYPGVVAVGAVARNGQVAPFSSRRSYVALTAPGVGLMSAVPPDGYERINSTSTSSGIVAGVAALILSRFPHLTAAQVGQALTGATTTVRTSAPGAGRGIIDAARAVSLASSISAAAEPSQPAATASPHQPGRLSTTAAHRANASDLAGSLVRYVSGRPVPADRAAGGAAPGHALPAGAGIGVPGHRGRRGARPRPAARAARAAQAGTRSRAGHPPGPVSAGPATRSGACERGRLGWGRRLAGRQQPGRDAAVPGRAVPPGHGPGAEAGQDDGQGGAVFGGPAVGARAAA